MKPILQLFVFLCLATTMLAQGNCEEGENFNQFDNGDLISEESNEWSIVVPSDHDDAVVEDNNLGGNTSEYLHILESSEINNPSFVEHNFDDVGGGQASFSLDLHKNLDAGQVVPSGAKFFVFVSVDGDDDVIIFEYDDSDNLFISFGNQSISENVFTLGWETWRFEFLDEQLTITMEGDVIGSFDVPGNEFVFHTVEYCGNFGQYWIDNLCFEGGISFDCTAPFIPCNTDGDDYIEDTTIPGSNVFPNTTPTDVLDSHDICDDVYDGCDDDNDYDGHNTTGHEIQYEVSGTGGNLVIDLHWGSSSDNLDLFVFEDCGSNGPDDCIATSTYPTTDFESIIIENAGSDEYQVIVDSRNSGDVSDFLFSVTCGDIDDHDARPLLCGIPEEGDTEDSDNYNSFYCNCEDQTRFEGRQNYGREDVYMFTIDEAGETTITLEIMDPDIDLNLYLLNDDDVFECNKASDDETPGETEIISFSNNGTDVLPPGDYYVVVEGYRGDEGPYILSLDHISCADPCSNQQALNCERFENLQVGDLINDEANWSQGDNGTISCQVAEENGNQFLAIGQDNFDVCASRYTIPNNTSQDASISLSFDMYLPFGEGFSFHINETDPEDFIFFNFSDYFGGGSTAINYMVNDAASSNSFEAFDYPYDEWFPVSITLNKSTQTLIVFVNNQQLINVDGSMIEDLADISFDANLTDQGSNGADARLDNLCLNSCSSDPVPDPCMVSNDLACEDLENCAIGDAVDNKNNWDDGFFPGQLFIASEGGDNFISIEQDGNDDASAIYEIPNNTGADELEILSFRVWIAEDGGLSTFYEADNGEVMSLDFVHQSGIGGSINFVVSDVFFTMDANGNPNVPANYEPETWFDVQFNLDKSNGNLDLFFDNLLVFSVGSSGLDELRTVEFNSALSPDDPSRVDDICISACGACEMPYEEILDCDQILIDEITPVADNETKFDLLTSEDLNIQYWEVTNLTTGEVNRIETTNDEISIFLPNGNAFQICVFYIDDNGCLIKCCIEQITTSSDEFLEDQISIYPNPVSEVLILDGIDLYNTTYQILNIMGQLSQRGSVHNNQIKRLDNLDKGVYILNLYDESGRLIIVDKFLKL